MSKIKLIPIQPNMIPMRDIKQISDGDRLFYEIVFKINPKEGYGDNLRRTGRFKEILNIKDMLANDQYINIFEYQEHHNFMLIKQI